LAVAERFLNLTKLDTLRTDRTLVRAAQAGRAEAASELIERYYPRVKSFVTYLTSGRGNSEDLTQEVFTRALTALPRFNGTYRFEPWLLRIARNLCIDESRRSSNRAAPTDPTELPSLERLSESKDDVWGQVSSGIATSLVHKALETLPARQRTVLILREIEGMSYADIAQVIGGTERVVEGVLRRARGRFRLEIARVEEAEGQRAVCKRVLRSIASEPDTISIEAARHIRACAECQSARSRLKKSDGIFGALPPITLAERSWTEGVVGTLKARPPSSRSVLQMFRSHSGLGLASPIANALEIVASLAVAASLSVATVTGQTARVTTQLSSAPSIMNPVVVELQTPPQASSLTDLPPATASAQSAEGAPAVSGSGGSTTNTGILSLTKGTLDGSLPVSLPGELAALAPVVSGLSDSLESLQSPLMDPFERELIATTTETPLLPEVPETTAALTSPISLPRRRFLTI